MDGRLKQLPGSTYCPPPRRHPLQLLLLLLLLLALLNEELVQRIILIKYRWTNELDLSDEPLSWTNPLDQ